MDDTAIGVKDPMAACLFAGYAHSLYDRFLNTRYGEKAEWEKRKLLIKYPNKRSKFIDNIF